MLVEEIWRKVTHEKDEINIHLQDIVFLLSSPSFKRVLFVLYEHTLDLW